MAPGLPHAVFRFAERVVRYASLVVGVLRGFAMFLKSSQRPDLAYALCRRCCGLIENGTRAATRQRIVHKHVCTLTCVFNLYTNVVQ